MTRHNSTQRRSKLNLSSAFVSLSFYAYEYTKHTHKYKVNINRLNQLTSLHIRDEEAKTKQQQKTKK